ncbi:PQ-loop domain-containing transporter [Mycoplasmopsis lipophila]|uniref:PQ-loop domain-containing transporter n=1 Tax=Mycoplasmopsis lipophila TaxID=2117 RepID=UPI0038733740
MEKFIEFFGMKSNYQTSGFLASLFGLVAAIMTISMSIPQLVKILKEKKVGEIKYYSFWIFFVAINGWVIFGGFSADKLVPAVFANAICSLIYIADLYTLYKYASGEKRKKMQWVVLGIASSISISSIIAGMIGTFMKVNFDANTTSVLSTIVPMLTTFAFAPQILKSFETKNFKGMSLGLVVVFLIANVCWILYWIFGLANLGIQGYILNALVWQVLQVTIYVVQFMMHIKYAKIEKLETTIKDKNNDYLNELAKKDAEIKELQEKLLEVNKNSAEQPAEQ